MRNSYDTLLQISDQQLLNFQKGENVELQSSDPTNLVLFNSSQFYALFHLSASHGLVMPIYIPQNIRHYFQFSF